MSQIKANLRYCQSRRKRQHCQIVKRRSNQRQLSSTNLKKVKNYRLFRVAHCEIEKISSLTNRIKTSLQEEIGEGFFFHLPRQELQNPGNSLSEEIRRRSNKYHELLLKTWIYRSNEQHLVVRPTGGIKQTFSRSLLLSKLQCFTTDERRSLKVVSELMNGST